jgi:hypothetical protein
VEGFCKGRGGRRAARILRRRYPGRKTRKKIKDYRQETGFLLYFAKKTLYFFLK